MRFPSFKETGHSTDAVKVIEEGRKFVGFIFFVCFGAFRRFNGSFDVIAGCERCMLHDIIFKLLERTMCLVGYSGTKMMI